MLGACLCGAVQIDVEVNSEEITVCHCSMCRTWGGGPALTVESTQKIKLTGQQFVRKYDSSEWAARYFCQQCGTNLFYKLNEREYYSINAELFDLASNAKIHLEIYADHKPDYYQFLTKSPQLTERQVIDQFSSDE